MGIIESNIKWISICSSNSLSQMNHWFIWPESLALLKGNGCKVYANPKLTFKSQTNSINLYFWNVDISSLTHAYD